MGLAELVKRLFGKNEEWIPFEDGKRFLYQIGVDVSRLNLPEAHNDGYAKSFRNLRAQPYMDVGELRVKVTGEYEVCPKRARYVESRVVPVTPIRIEIDTSGRIPNRE